MGSILIMGVFLVLVSWGQTSGWGTNLLTGGAPAAKTFAGAPQLPAFILGQRYWGGAWWIVLFALFNSAIAVSIACTNASTRFLYGMARAKALPVLAAQDRRQAADAGQRRLPADGHQRAARPDPADLHRSRQRVQRDRHLVHLRAGLRVHRGQCRPLPVLQARAPDEFSYLKHLVIPAIGTLALPVVVYYSVNPLPAWPVGIAPFIVLGWLAIGVIVVFTVYRGNRAMICGSRGRHGRGGRRRDRGTIRRARSAATARRRAVAFLPSACCPLARVARPPRGSAAGSGGRRADPGEPSSRASGWPSGCNALPRVMRTPGSFLHHHPNDDADHAWAVLDGPCRRTSRTVECRNAARRLVSSTPGHATRRRSPGPTQSITVMLTRGSRSMLRCLTRPSTVENNTSSPSQPPHDRSLRAHSGFTVTRTA